MGNISVALVMAVPVEKLLSEVGIEVIFEVMLEKFPAELLQSLALAFEKTRCLPETRGNKFWNSEKFYLIV
jgi:hypothetical protein